MRLMDMGFVFMCLFARHRAPRYDSTSHQVVKGTFTLKLSSMFGTHKNKEGVIDSLLGLSSPEC